METLIRHLVEPIVAHPEAVSVQIVEGEAVTMCELLVHPDDYDRIEDERGRTLRAIRNVVSAAAGHQKATVDLVKAHGAQDEE